MIIHHSFGRLNGLSTVVPAPQAVCRNGPQAGLPAGRGLPLVALAALLHIGLWRRALPFPSRPLCDSIKHGDYNTE